MMMEVSLLSPFNNLYSAGLMFGCGGLALLSTPTMSILAFAFSTPRTFLSPSSTAATISVTGTFLGAGAKLRPFLRTTFSSVVSSLEDLLTTHLSTISLTLPLLLPFANNRSNFEFAFCLSLHFVDILSYAYERMSTKCKDNIST